MNNIKAVIFDMDGVLFDTERVYLESWIKVFKEYGYTMTKEMYIPLMGTGRKNVKEVFKKTFGDNIPIEEMYVKKDELLFKAIDNNEVPLKLGAIDILCYLKEEGYKIALATSAKRDRVTKQIQANNMNNMFNAIVCGDDVVNSKPDPEIFLKAAKKLDVNPENCVVIEDSLAGIKGANKGGMKGFHVEDLKKADDEIKTLSTKTFKNLVEIKEYLRDNNCI
ncbi:HAD family phosphatase [uncultured Clostridium sp.]|uniref:HAD family hydrolase n=1 Tax=uncultured Clostridium sp. TaxID=59620 RepID=UPI0025E2C4B6|nr:HAD family phosphatase [uncultured Clostridium sp.]